MQKKHGLKKTVFFASLGRNMSRILAILPRHFSPTPWLRSHYSMHFEPHIYALQTLRNVLPIFKKLVCFGGPGWCGAKHSWKGERHTHLFTIYGRLILHIHIQWNLYLRETRDTRGVSSKNVALHMSKNSNTVPG